jgi:C-terminal processing protease CtpA/Prc
MEFVLKGMKMKLLCALVALTLSACVNPYSQFYRPGIDAKTMPSYVPASGPLTIYTTNDFPKDVDGLIRKGYTPIGNASFNADSNQVSESQLRDQAEKVSAQVVLISSHYTHTVTGAMPLVLPNTTTSYSSGSATAYGPGGTVNAYGNSTTTTYGSQTTMVPFSVARSDFGAVFFVKTRARVGIIAAPIDDATRKRLGTNSGILVRLIVDGSPAFNADIFPGDIVLAMGSEKVQSPEQYMQLLNQYEGQSVTFHLDRDGQAVEKTFRIASYKDPVN